MKRKREFSIDSRKLNIWGSILSISALLGSIVVIYTDNNQYSLKYEENRVHISKIKGNVDTIKNDSAKVKVVNLKEQLNSATDLGNNVTNMVNTWDEPLTEEEKQADAAKNGAPMDPNANQSNMAVNKTRIDNLTKYFYSDSVWLKQNWYPKIPNSPSANSEWSFVTATSFSSSTQKVMWQEKNKTTGELYAYATADYNVSKNQFTNLSVTVTAVGQKAQVPTNQEGGN